MYFCAFFVCRFPTNSAFFTRQAKAVVNRTLLRQRANDNNTLRDRPVTSRQTTPAAWLAPPSHAPPAHRTACSQKATKHPQPRRPGRNAVGCQSPYLALCGDLCLDRSACTHAPHNSGDTHTTACARRTGNAASTRTKLAPHVDFANENGRVERADVLQERHHRVLITRESRHRRTRMRHTTDEAQCEASIAMVKQGTRGVP